MCRKKGVILGDIHEQLDPSNSFNHFPGYLELKTRCQWLTLWNCLFYVPNPFHTQTLIGVYLRSSHRNIGKQKHAHFSWNLNTIS